MTVVTGLPLDYYQSQAKDFRNSILGIQPVTKWKSGSLAGKEKRINVEIADSLIALIDIGFRTTDYVVVEIQENGSFIPISKYSGTVDQGVNKLHMSIQQTFKAKVGGSDLPGKFIKQILKNALYFIKEKRLTSLILFK